MRRSNCLNRPHRKTEPPKPLASKIISAKSRTLGSGLTTKLSDPETKSMKDEKSIAPGSLQRLVRPRHQRPLYKTWKWVETILSPLTLYLFWNRVWFEVILHNHTGWLSKLSRTTNLVRLLDTGALWTWPNPRWPIDPNAGSLLAHLILRLRNPRLECRDIAGRSATTFEERFSAYQIDYSWRMEMFTTYGDKWPNDPSSATRPTGRNDCNLDAMAGFAAAHG